MPGSADGPAADALFNNPGGVAVDAAGNLFVADTLNYVIRKITPAGTVTTLAGTAGLSEAVDGLGSEARFVVPWSVAVDGTGNVFVGGGRGSTTVRKITSGGVVTTLAGTAGLSGSADGAGSDARFVSTIGVSADRIGNIFVADPSGHTIREITPAGAVTTLAGKAGSSGSSDGPGTDSRFYGPSGLAVDGTGNIFVADTANHTIRKITPARAVTTLAGTSGVSGSADGAGAAAGFYRPWGVAVDDSGNVYVGDSGNNTIRKITPAGVVTTLAGTAGVSGSENGPGTVALFKSPHGVAVDRDGNVYVADAGNHTIRKITISGH